MIKQLYTSRHVRFFEKFILNKYKMHRYNNNIEPTIFLGCYENKDIDLIKKHKGLKVVIFGGSDLNKNFVSKLKIKDKLQKLSMLDNIYLLSISDFIKKVIDFHNIKNIRMPICFATQNMNLYPVNKGKYVYVYANMASSAKYNIPLINKIISKMPDTQFIITSHGKNTSRFKNTTSGRASRENIIKYYEKCFIGIRLTPFDGNANTVQELGLCGIKCIFNGDKNLPSAISWKNENDIIENINKEKKKIGTSDPLLAYSVSKYFNNYDNKNIFTNEEYYKNFDFNKTSEDQEIFKKNIENEKIFLPELTKINNLENVIENYNNTKNIKIEKTEIENLIKENIELKKLNKKKISLSKKIIKNTNQNNKKININITDNNNQKEKDNELINLKKKYSKIKIKIKSNNDKETDTKLRDKAQILKEKINEIKSKN